MEVADKERLYKYASGRNPDCRSKGGDPKLRLGSVKGCLPLVWHPRSIDLAKSLLQDFEFKQMVDLYSGDASWALAKAQLSAPKPYIGFTMSSVHSTWNTKIVHIAIREAMATDGHNFCSNESLSLIQQAFPDIARRVEQGEEEEDVPEESEGGEQSELSEGEHD